MSLLVPFGLRDGQLYEPRHGANGKDCGCICPGCHHPLIARQNAPTPHFAHAPGQDCKTGGETSIHYAAKQLIAERMKISLPAVNLQFPGGYGDKPCTQSLYTSTLRSLSEVRIEPWLDGFRPDLVVVDLDRPREILIEIAVTHCVDESKLAQIKNRGLHAVEIDVSSAREKMDFALLTKVLFDVPSSGVWLHHPRADELEQEYLVKRERDWKAREKTQYDRFENYRNLNPLEQTRRNVAKAGVNPKILKALTVFVPGEKSYAAGREAWQSAVLAYISNKIKDDSIEGFVIGVELDTETLEDWLSKLFEVEPIFPDGEKIALWMYLKHLETLGLIRHERNKKFDILMHPKDFN